MVSALGVTVVAVLGGAGVLSSAASSGSERRLAVAASVDRLFVADPVLGRSGADATERRTSAVVATRTAAATARAERRLPADSGSGLRVVFSESRQRVWLVRAGERIERTYLVSGSIYDNLDPGTYQVFSRSEQAWGINNSGSMKYFVRFAQGPNAAIGFHDIPIAGGRPVQGLDQLGTPLSHGCVRQRRADAIALWEFAPMGTTVVVTP